mgnify:CR=1 FL=1
MSEILFYFAGVFLGFVLGYTIRSLKAEIRSLSTKNSNVNSSKRFY